MLPRLLFFVYAYAATGGFLFGYDIGCVSGALEGVKADKQLNLTESQVEVFVGQCKFGAAIGAVAATRTLRVGYVTSFWCSALAYVLGPLLIAGSSSWAVMTLGRLVVGVGIGLSSVASPTYLADVAPPASRGCVVGLFELMLTIGVLTATGVNYVLQHPDVAAALRVALPQLTEWRIMLSLPALPAIPFLLLSLFLPEAPSTLAMRGQFAEALELLRRLHGLPPGAASTVDELRSPIAADDVRRHEDASSALNVHGPLRNDLSNRSSNPHSALEDVDNSTSDACSNASHPRVMRFTGASSHGSFADLTLDLPLSLSFERLETQLHTPEERQMLETLVHAHAMGRQATPAHVLLVGRERHAAVLMMVLAIANQANGSSTLLNYSADILTDQRYGFSNQGASLLSLVVCTMKLLCVLLSILVVDRCGRRPMLLAGALLTAASLACGAYGVYMESAPLLLTGLISFVAFYALSLAPTFYTLLSELFSSNARPLAAGLGTAITFAAGALMDTIFLSLKEAVDYSGVFAIYAAVCVLGGAVVWLLLPETKGQTLYQIQHSLANQRACGSCRAGGELLAAEADEGGLSQPFSAEETPDEAGQLRKRTSSAFVLAS